MAGPQTMAIAPAIARLGMAEAEVVELVDTARQVALAGTTTAQVLLPLVALEQMVLVVALAEAAVVLESLSPPHIRKSMGYSPVGTVAVSASRVLAQVARVERVVCTIHPLVAWEQVDHLEQQDHFLPQGHMAVALAAATLDMNGNHLMIPADQLIHAAMSPLAALALSVSCGAVVAPILLTQRTYNA